MEQKYDKPLACVIYICKECAFPKKFFELYFESKQDTKYCHVCRSITLHERILPTDDDTKNYQRPSLL